LYSVVVFYCIDHLKKYAAAVSYDFILHVIKTA